MQNSASAGLANFRNALMYFKVWSRNGVNFEGYSKDFKKLIWPDLRKSLFKRPLDLKIFFNEIKEKFPEQHKLLFGNKFKLYYYFGEMLIQSLRKMISIQRKKLNRLLHFSDI